MARIAITGSSGFIGRNLTARLEKQKHTIYRVNREQLWYPDSLKKELSTFKPEYIYHLAAYGNHNSQQDEKDLFEGNVLSTYNLLQATRAIPYKAFIHFGSSSEYGMKALPMREENILEPVSMYGAMKAASTMLCRGYSKTYDKPIVTIRPFSVYGEGEADFRFIPTIIRCALSGDTLTLEPSSTHDWIYIQDFLDALEKIVRKAGTFQGNAVNIGTGIQTSNKEVVTLLGRLIGKPIKTRVAYGLRPKDSSSWVANTITLRVLKSYPKYSLSQGLLLTYKYYWKKYISE